MLFDEHLEFYKKTEFYTPDKMAKITKVCIALAIGLLILTVTTTPAFGATVVHKVSFPL